MKKCIIVIFTMVIILQLATFSAVASEVPEVLDGKQGEFVVTLSHATAETTSLHHGAVKFKEDIETLSKGRIVVNIYPNAQLGGDRETIEGTQVGQITLMASSNAVQVNFVPSAVIFDLPFVYPNMQVARDTLKNTEFVEAISAEYEKHGLRYIGASDQGFRTLTSNKEVHTPEDLQGVTMRTMENKYHMSVWRAIGANPTPLAFNELYTGLQQGTVDAQENPIELIHSQKFFEQQKYVVYTNHIYQTIVWIMNNDFYQNLPEDLQKAVDYVTKNMIVSANEYQDSNQEEYIAEMKAYGVDFIELSEDELRAFADKAQTTWEMIRNDCSPTVYDAFMRALEQAKAK